MPEPQKTEALILDQPATETPRKRISTKTWVLIFGIDFIVTALIVWYFVLR